MDNKDKLLIEYCQAEGRVCPMPTFWNELWKMLPDSKQKSTGGWEPPLPLILAAWQDTTNIQKRERLICHINYAEKKGVTDKIDKYVRSLTEDQWLYKRDI